MADILSKIDNFICYFFERCLYFRLNPSKRFIESF